MKPLTDICCLCTPKNKEQCRWCWFKFLHKTQTHIVDADQKKRVSPLKKTTYKLDDVIIFWKGNTGRILAYRFKKVN